ncbi:MAG: SCO family protein [Nitrospirae bacterium]|nr:SCO family protein [Nitrospirota bacterium]MBI3393502.1 SCO family protein [Nitrospirota bacterium]
MKAPIALLFLVAWAAAAEAGYNRPALQDAFDPNALRIDEGWHLGQTVPDVSVQTESGQSRLYDLIDGRPTILILAYYTCHGPCPTTIRNLLEAVRPLEGGNYRVLVLSFDKNDTLENMRRVVRTVGPVPSSWTFGLLSPEDSQRLTQAVGFTFFFSERDRAFIHPTVLTFLSPNREVTRYLYGTSPREQDIRLALAESRDRIGRLNELVDMAALVCYRYDPSRSRYVIHPALIFGGIGLGVLGVTGIVSFMYGRSPKGGRKQ